VSEDDFLSRWSRRKHQANREAAQPAPAPANAPAQPALPPLESLTFESDFTPFLAANVAESVKRAALKKLLHDPRFNVMDGLDTYIDDYTKNDPIPDEMLKRLEHARSTFQGLERPKDEPQKNDQPQMQQDEEKTETAQRESEAQPETQAKEAGSGDPRQDT
jgi:hypothetical protein